MQLSLCIKPTVASDGTPVLFQPSEDLKAEIASLGGAGQLPNKALGDPLGAYYTIHFPDDLDKVYIQKKLAAREDVAGAYFKPTTGLP